MQRSEEQHNISKKIVKSWVFLETVKWKSAWHWSSKKGIHCRCTLLICQNMFLFCKVQTYTVLTQSSFVFNGVCRELKLLSHCFLCMRSRSRKRCFSLSLVTVTLFCWSRPSVCSFLVWPVHQKHATIHTHTLINFTTKRHQRVICCKQKGGLAQYAEYLCYSFTRGW